VYPGGRAPDTLELVEPSAVLASAFTSDALCNVPTDALRGTRVLLVEDGPDNQRLISFVLRKAGAEVETAENGKLAVDRALTAQGAGQPYDVVRMDMQMPVMDGYAATKQLRHRGYASPVVVLTAHAVEGDRERCVSAGCNDNTTKPTYRKQLIDTLVRHAGRSFGPSPAGERGEEVTGPKPHGSPPSPCDTGFLDHLPSRVASIRQIVAARDLDTAAAPAARTCRRGALAADRRNTF
jgi:CheY-like chemotaxis protein